MLNCGVNVSILLNKWLKLSNNRRFKCKIYLLILLSCLLKCFWSSTCSSSVSSANAITSKQVAFSSYSSDVIQSVVQGEVSNCLYYMHSLSSSSSVEVVIKMNPDDTVSWATSVLFSPLGSSLSVSLDEQYVYLGNSGTTLEVCRIMASTGNIIDTQNLFINADSYRTIIHLISDNSGYYVSGYVTSSQTYFCKYLFSTPSAIQCQQIQSSDNSLYGQLKISDTSFYMLINMPTSTNLYLFRFEFLSSTPSWEKKMICSGTCNLADSISLLSSDRLKIHSFFVYGSTSYVYFTSFSVSDGSILSTRYKSSDQCFAVYGAALSGEYIAASIVSSPNQALIIFNTVTTIFITREFTGFLFKTIVDNISGRLVVIGSINGNGYIETVVLKI